MRGWVSCDFICRSWRGRREGEARCQVWGQVWGQVRGLARKMGSEGEKVNR